MIDSVRTFKIIFDNHNLNTLFVLKMYRAFDNGDADMQAILAKYEIHILPLVNPDGYEFSHTTVNSSIFKNFNNDLILFI